MKAIPSHLLTWILLSQAGTLAFAAGQFDHVLEPGWTNEPCYSWSASWGDYNHDGYPDLFIGNASTSGSGPYQSFVYRNNGANALPPFSRMTTSDVGPLADDFAVGGAASWVDLNNDDLLDLLKVRAATNRTTPEPIGVYLNEGNGKLAPASAGALTKPTFVLGAALADYDNDGFVDVYQLAAWSDPNWPPIRTNRLFRGGPNLAFVEVQDSEVCRARTTTSNSSAWGDYDNDGDVDLIVANISQPAFFFENQGNGQFMRLTNSATKGATARINPAWGDYDNDGDLDLFIIGDPHSYLFQNAYPSDFIVTLDVGFGGYPVGGYPSWVDYDNDGWLDLFISRGQGATTANDLLRNNGDGTFTGVDDTVTAPGRWIVGAWGDYDNDGFMDLFVASVTGANALHHNLGNANHWLKLTLRGVASNRSALGAKVRVQATIAGKPIWQMRQVTSGGWPQDDIRPNFGLGDAATADLVRIEWPSGIVQTLTNVPANQILAVTESQSYAGSPPRFAGAASVPTGIELTISEPPAGTRYILEASPDLTIWTKQLARTSQGANIEFIDTHANNGTMRFYRLQVP